MQIFSEKKNSEKTLYSPTRKESHSFFHSVPEPFTVIQSGNQIVFENRYVKCTHDLSCGGGLSSAIIKNGSGKNILVKPQTFLVGICERGRGYHCYFAGEAQSRIDRNGECPAAEFRSRFFDSDGKCLDGLGLVLRVVYGEWGEVRFQAEFEAEHDIVDLGMVQVGSMYLTESMDFLGIQNGLYDSAFSCSNNGIKSWIPLQKSNFPAHISRHLPLSLTVLHRGLEGFQFFRGGNLAQWDTNIAGVPPANHMCYFIYNPSIKGYEMRISALDALRPGQYFRKGVAQYDFILAFPFVREKMVPLEPCAGGYLYMERRFEERWPTEEDLQTLENAGTKIMRLHNDGDKYGNGIFWRAACAYPPYPPDEMEKMKASVAAAHKHGIAVVPYFSCHEYHEKSPGFQEHSQEWARLVEPEDHLIFNYTQHDMFGALMCLHSGWLEKRMKTIDETLSTQLFDGIYYDWCVGMECRNEKHGKGRHWDFEELLELLYWTSKRVGEKGVVYLHLTNNPNLIGENLASLVLTEEAGGNMIYPEMFTPQAHFINVAPRQVCCMTSGDVNCRKYALCALLHHATVSSHAKVFTDFYTEYRQELSEVTQYSHHTAPGEGVCSTSAHDAGVSAYWNASGEIMVFAVNLSDKEQEIPFSFEREELKFSGKVKVRPLKLAVVKNIKR